MKKKEMAMHVTLVACVGFIVWIWTYWPNWTLSISKWYTLPCATTVTAVLLWKFKMPALKALLLQSVVFLCLCLIVFGPNWAWGVSKWDTLWGAALFMVTFMLIAFFVNSHVPEGGW